MTYVTQFLGEAICKTDFWKQIWDTLNHFRHSGSVLGWATLTKRGAYQWQAKVRRKGYSAASNTYDTKAEAKRRATDIERDMDRGIFVSRTEAESTTLKEALTRYLQEIPPHKKGAKQEREPNQCLLAEIGDCYLMKKRAF